jgi:hypothetical protein
VIDDLGSGVCERAGQRIVCTESLPNLDVDREKARERMRESGLSRDELEQRLRVTDVFRADPIGIVEFELSSSSE